MAKTELQGAICLPGETGWELWKAGSGGLHLAQSMALEDGGSPAAFKEAQIFGYPVVAAFAVPVWAATADPTLFDGIVQIQLEKQGLFPDNPVGQLVDTKVVEREESQTLLVATVLNEQVSGELPQQRPQGFEISPWLFYLPDNQVVLWKELGRLVLCVTRREHPVYFHALTAAELDDAAVDEVESLMMPLYMQGVIGELEGVTLWTDAVESTAVQRLANVLHLPLKRQAKPAPVHPVAPSAFEPSSVALAKIREAKLRKVRHIVSAVAAVYLVIIAGLAGYYLWTLKKNADLKAEVNTLRPRVAFVLPTIQQWESTAALRDKNQFVIEILRRTLEPIAVRQFANLKVTGVRVETASIEGAPRISSIEIKGETRAQPPVITYRGYLSNSKELTDFEWNSPVWGPQRGESQSWTITGKNKNQQSKENDGA